MSHVAFWAKDERPILLLITKELYDELPNGTVLWDINGDRNVKGQDDIDDDTRGGFLAYGFHLEHERDPLGRQWNHDRQRDDPLEDVHMQVADN